MRIGAFLTLFFMVLSGCSAGANRYTTTPVVAAAPVYTPPPTGISTPQSVLSVSASIIGIGSRLVVTFSAKDGNGFPITNGGATIVISWAGTASFSPGNSVTATYAGNGNYQASFEGTLIGTATFSAAINTVPASSTALVTVQTSPPVLIASVGTTTHGSGLTGQRHMFYDASAGNWWFLYLNSADTANIESIYSNDGSTWQAGPVIPLPAGKLHNDEGSQIALDFKIINGNGVLYVGYTYDGASNSVSQYITRVAVTNTVLSPSSWILLSGPLTLSGGSLPSLAHSVSLLGDGSVLVMSSALEANGNFYAVSSTTQDSGVTGVTTFTSPSILAVVNNWARHSALFSMTSGMALTIADDVLNLNNFSNDFYGGMFNSGVWTQYLNNGTWGPGLTNENAVSSNFLLPSHLATNIAYEDWAGIGVSGSEAELVSRSDDSVGSFDHMRFTGSSWVTGNTIPPLISVAGTGLALTTDGTNAWLFAIANDSANSIQYIKWTSGVGWDAAWTMFDSSTAVRTSLTTTEVADAYGFFEVIWTDSSGNINVEPFTP